MPTTFRELTNKLIRRLNEVEISVSNFPSVIGVQALAKDAINASISTIQNQRFDWPFNYTSGSQLLTVGTELYAFPADLKAVDWNSFYIEKDDTLSVNTYHLELTSKDQWLRFYRDNDYDSGTDGVNLPIFVFPDTAYKFGITPSPDKAYTVRFDYVSTFVPLDLYTDTSTIPSNFDEVIIQGALYHFYMFRDNDTQAQLADKKYKDLLSDMLNQLGIREERMESTLIPFGSGLAWASQPVYKGGSGD